MHFFAGAGAEFRSCHFQLRIVHRDAAGLTDLTWNSPGETDRVADGEAAISRQHGVERITLPAEAKTSNGIGVGSTFAEVKRAYPNALRVPRRLVGEGG